MFGETPLVMVEDNEALRSLVEKLRDAPVIGIDTEADSFHHYREKLCLIQVSDRHADYIIDPLKVDDLSPFGEILSNPSIVKVLHGGDYDVVSLKRDFGFELRNLFDTMIAAQFLALPRIGLADLIERYFGHEIDKKYQRHDWAERPLLPEHLEYARGDTHWLLAIREVMSLFLDREGRLQAHREECVVLEGREWQRDDDEATAFLRVKRINGLDAQGLRVLRAVWQYRDSQARRMDRPAFKVLPDDVLVALAQNRPTEEEALHNLLKRGSPMLRRHGEGLLQAVRAGVADNSPLPDREPKTRGRSSGVSSAQIERILGPLKDWRNRMVNEKGLNPVVIANNNVLKEIARLAPTNLEALSAVPGIRDWQVRDFGEEIVAVVARLGPERPEPSDAAAAKRRRRRRR